MSSSSVASSTTLTLTKGVIKCPVKLSVQRSDPMAIGSSSVIAAPVIIGEPTIIVALSLSGLCCGSLDDDMGLPFWIIIRVIKAQVSQYASGSGGEYQCHHNS